eukprot:g4453.t1
MQCKWCIRVAVVGSVLLFIISLSSLLWIPSYIHDEIHRQIKDYIVLRPGKAEDSYTRFVSDTEGDGETYYTRFYFFNITNLDDVRYNGSKPILQECGPYTYRTSAEKVEVAFYWNGSISYKERTYYYPEPSMTTGTFNDIIITLNMPLVGVLKRIQNISNSFVLRLIMGRIVSYLSQSGEGLSEGLFVGRTVNQLLWGYNDPLLQTLSRLARRWVDVGPRFSLMTNGSIYSIGSEPTSVIHSGFNDITKIGQMEQWNGLKATVNWNNYSEPVQGTSGNFFRPFLSENDQLTIWIPQMYRSMNMIKGADAKILGIDVYRYFIDPEFWAPDDRFYDTYQGLINVTGNSAAGSPGPYLYFSPPYFCGADPNLTEAVIGVECKGDDEFYVDVEPFTGISLRGAIRFMISTEYSAEFDSIDPNLTRTILPVFWLNEQRKATKKQTKKIRDDLYWALDLKHTLKITLLVSSIVSGFLSLAFLSWSVYRYILKRNSDRQWFSGKYQIILPQQQIEGENYFQAPFVPVSNGVDLYTKVDVERSTHY